MCSSAAQKLGQPLDIFVVNSFGSLAQTFFVLLLLPITTALKVRAAAEGMPAAQLLRTGQSRLAS